MSKLDKINITFLKLKYTKGFAMKNLVLIRHAKSSWKDETLKDFDRPLNKRGKHNAPFMGQKLKELVPTPDLIISSGALRAITTAKFIKENVHYDKEIKVNNKIYHLDEDYILLLLRKFTNEETIYLIGHNPTLNNLANFLVKFDLNLPTAGFLHITFDINSWEDISSNNSKLNLFEYPKKFILD